jgi:hypothetical protein
LKGFLRAAAKTATNSRQSSVLYRAEWEICNDYGESKEEASTVNTAMKHYQHHCSLPTELSSAPRQA